MYLGYNMQHFLESCKSFHLEVEFMQVCVLMIWHVKGVILSAIFNFITIKLFQKDAGGLWPGALNQFENSFVEFVTVHSQEEISAMGTN